MKNNKGITLIALVITIIVLLILAGVVINSIISNENVMEKAKQAKSANESTEEFDTIKLAAINALAKGSTGYITGENLADALTGIVSDSQISLIRENANGPWQVQGNNGVYNITNTGEVYEATLATISQNTIEFEEGATNTPVTLTVSPIDGVTISSVTWSVPSDNGLVTISETTGNSTTVSVKSSVTKLVENVTATVTSSTGKTQDLICEVNYKETVVNYVTRVSDEQIMVFPNTTSIIKVEGRGRLGGKVDLKESDIPKISYEYYDENVISVSSPDPLTGFATVTGVSGGYTSLMIKFHGGRSGGNVYVSVRGTPDNPVDLGVDIDGSGSSKDDWEILYDGTDSEDSALHGNIYCILAGLLPNERRKELGIHPNDLDTKNSLFNVCLAKEEADKTFELIGKLNGTDDSWKALISDTISSIEGVQVQGAITKNLMDKIKTARGGSYYSLSQFGNVNGGYWLASGNYMGGNWGYYVRYIKCDGTSDGSTNYYSSSFGVCPVVTIPSDKVTITTGADGVKTVTPKAE